MEGEHVWPLIPKAKHIIYTPQPLADFDNWFHSYLGYPVCPIIGRYNKGEYKMGQTLLDLDFKCSFDHTSNQYLCGDHLINIPNYIVDKLRNIPEVIPFNKPKNFKKGEQVHEIQHIPQDKISFNWIISFGAMGKDFLNYLNHTYLFDQSIFNTGKLLNTTFNLPILFYLPEGSGVQNKQVERGISNEGYRSQYMSIHLKGGAPAFSPNNMRIGIEGMREVKTPNPQGNKNKKNKKNKKQFSNEQQQQMIPKQQNLNNIQKQQKQMLNIDESLFDQDDLFDEKQKKCSPEHKQKNQKIEKEQKKQHQKYIHFYTSVLLPDDHRVNYHWHIEDEQRQGVIRQLLESNNLKQFIENYRNFIGDDAMLIEIVRLGFLI